MSRKLRMEYPGPGIIGLCQACGSSGVMSRDVLWLAARKYPDQSWPLEAIVRMGGGKEGTAGIWRMFKMTYQRNPQDPQMGNNYASFALLLNQDMPRAGEIAAALYAANPTNAYFASTRAFALLKQGQSQQAVAVLQQLTAEQLRIPVIGAYYGMALVAGGQASEARPFLDRASKASLLPEEQALVKCAQAGSNELVQALRSAEDGQVRGTRPPASKLR